jgi:geranylgeranyl diphosphate synthase type II
MQSEIKFRSLIESELQKLKLDNHPPKLYDPIRYMLSLDGKRIRPSLLLMSNELFNATPEEVINLALGIEVFHNFTLLHDDIMDKAPLRRMQETVHKKWSSDIAILSGDAMFVKSCQLMMTSNDKILKDILNTFFKTAIEVCEGQQLDMDFENTNSVTEEDYIQMISLKTASLLGCSTYIGALSGGASKNDAEQLYSFGKNLGIAFQLHDDILDVYGDSEKFGKQIGGDILANKKTFLLITALKKAEGRIKTDLNKILTSTNFHPQEKIESVVSIYEELNIRHSATEKMELFFKQAMNAMKEVSVSENKKADLIELADRLMVREK